MKSRAMSLDTSSRILTKSLAILHSSTEAQSHCPSSKFYHASATKLDTSTCICPIQRPNIARMLFNSSIFLTASSSSPSGMRTTESLRSRPSIASSRS